MMNCQKDPTCDISLKRGLFKDIKNYSHMCQTRKYKNTNTQIKHMTKCQKDPICGIFLKRGLFKDIKNDIPMCQWNIRQFDFCTVTTGLLFQLSSIHKMFRLTPWSHGILCQADN